MHFFSGVDNARSRTLPCQPDTAARPGRTAAVHCAAASSERSPSHQHRHRGPGKRASPGQVRSWQDTWRTAPLVVALYGDHLGTSRCRERAPSTPSILVRVHGIGGRYTIDIHRISDLHPSLPLRTHCGGSNLNIPQPDQRLTAWLSGPAAPKLRQSHYCKRFDSEGRTSDP